MSTVNAPAYCRKAMKTKARVRNGNLFRPDAEFMTLLQEEANRIVAYRTKAWTVGCALSQIPSAGGAGTRARWRFAFHTSTFCNYLWVRVVSASSRNATDPYTSVRFNIPGAGVTAQADFHFGNNTITTPDVPAYFGSGDVPCNDGTQVVAVTANSDYECVVFDVDNARTISVEVWEVSKPTDTANGYLASGIAAGDPIFDTHRELLIPLLRNAWLKNAAPLITWASNTDATAPANTGSTYKNVLSTSVTTVSAASPGFTLDMTYKSSERREASGVPCIMKVYGKDSVVGASGGNVLLLDSGGSTIASVDMNSTSASWFTSAAFYLPATLAKYDLHFRADSGIGTATVYAVSIYQIDS